MVAVMGADGDGIVYQGARLAVACVEGVFEARCRPPALRQLVPDLLLQRRVEIEEALTQQARYRYEKAVLTALREVDDALVDIEMLRRQTAAIERRLKAAANANFLSKERYDKGVTSYLEVLDSERTLFEVELGNSERRQQLFNAYVRLYKALGGGWMTKEAMAQQEAQATTP